MAASQGVRPSLPNVRCVQPALATSATAAPLGGLAATGAGAEIATTPAIARTIDPVAGLITAFDEGHARYRAAAQAIRGLT